ncbi:hypothetical protein [Usitatibacter palustris]|uniref:Uncharacterized protein n=1 Tax=Usitatibacter palustris TaxID=2732487 RepID=A0A6M4H3Q4_9PROT|nr:hypothetical protein [Usitatibacter palustris]QJR13343.1 hypothetical protein DSM104440_00126 [Usitatibacter palustris]
MTMPNGLLYGQEGPTGVWNRWKVFDVQIEGAEGVIPWSAYTCVCARENTMMDVRSYFQRVTRNVTICFECEKPTIAEWNTVGPKTYYGRQTRDWEIKKVNGGLSSNAKLIMEFDCDEKCKALNK